MSNLPPEEDEAKDLGEPRRRKSDRPVVTRTRNTWRKLNDWLARSPLVAYLVLVGSIAYGFSLVDENTDALKEQQGQIIQARDEGREKFQTALSAVVAVQIKNCEGDHKFRIQYKKRGQAEKLLLELFLSLAQENIDAGRGGTRGIQTSEDFIKQFGPLTQQIHIIPVPDCDDQAKKLIREIERVGGTVPASVVESAIRRQEGKGRRAGDHRGK